MSIDPTKVPDPLIPYYTLTIYNLYLFEKSKFKDYDSLLGNRFTGRQARANNLASVLENGYAISANGTLVRIHDEHESKVANEKVPVTTSTHFICQYVASFTLFFGFPSGCIGAPTNPDHMLQGLLSVVEAINMKSHALSSYSISVSGLQFPSYINCDEKNIGVEAHEAFFLQTPMKYCLFKHPDQIISSEIPPIHDNLSKLYWLDLADNQLIRLIPVSTSSSLGLYLLKKEEHLRAKLENHHNAGKTLDDAFTAVFGKDKPGRVRGYGRSVTTTSLKEDEEMKKIKQKHANEVTSMKKKL
ncbi:hypothetical protein FXO38_12071 [Capsicum annuum]|nr:hypothetical protein FXO38_12071 [Capsicum annuum]